MDNFFFDTYGFDSQKFSESLNKKFNQKFDEFKTFQDHLNAGNKVYDPNGEWKTYEPRGWYCRSENEAPKMDIPAFNLFNMNAGQKGNWTAPIGYDKFIGKGYFAYCRPIIKPGARINTRIFETINFEMVC